MKKLFLFLFCVFSITGYAQNSSSSFDPYWYKGHTFGIATNLVSSPDSKCKGLKPKTKTYLDQAFDNAIEGDDGRLCAKIDVKKKLKYDDIVAYINDQNAHTTVTIMGNNATMTGVRLDPHDPKAIVTTVLFLKKGDYKNYALKKLAKCAKSKEVTNGTNADAYLCFPEEYKPTQVFSQNNVVWNGSISNGKISGRGQGYYYNNGSIIYFVGFFIDGYPSFPSGCRFLQYSICEDEIFQGNKVKSEAACVKDFGEGLAAFYASGYSVDYWGFINQFGKMVIKPQYKNAVEPFNDGKAVVYDDKRHSNIIINTNGDFVDYDEKYIYDKKINNAAVKSYSLLSSTGKGMFFNYSNGTMINNFKWSGEVVDGMINGNGTGFAKNGKKYYYVNGSFVNGFPFGDVVFQELNSATDDLNEVKPVEYKFEFGERSEGMVFVRIKNHYNYSLINEQGNCIAFEKYREVLKPFENGYAEVFKDGKEIIIDKTGEFVDYTAHQKELDKAEAEAAEQERIAAQKAELARKNQTRIEEINKEMENLKEQLKNLAMDEWKRSNLVGKQIYWKETITYEISNGNQGLVLNLLSSALGANKVSYEVTYGAVVESYIGSTACKAIITVTEINDPNWASANYIKYRKAAQNDINQNIGQTRVKQLNEIGLAHNIANYSDEYNTLSERTIKTPEGKKAMKRIDELKAELQKLQGE